VKKAAVKVKCSVIPVIPQGTQPKTNIVIRLMAGSGNRMAEIHL